MKVKRHEFLAVLLLFSITLACCGNTEKGVTVIQTDIEADIKSEKTKSIDCILENMTLREKVGQLFIVSPEALEFEGEEKDEKISEKNSVRYLDSTIRENMRNYPPGGIVLFSRNILSPEQLTELNSNFQSESRYPLFISVDEEGGEVARLANHPAFKLKKYESAFSVGLGENSLAAENMGSYIGSYLKKYGFNMDFAPVADVNTNPLSPVIGARAFSSDAKIAAKMSGAMAKGLKEEGIIPVYKHFPGHGNTAGDSHAGIAVSYRNAEEFEKCEWLPFLGAGENDCIMAGHIAAPRLTGNMIPASISEEIINDVLRERLNFGGLIVTDSFSMKAVTDNYSPDEAAIAAVRAGCDIILMPEDYRTAFEGLISAVQSGELSVEDIDIKTRRILEFKMRAGMGF